MKLRRLVDNRISRTAEVSVRARCYDKSGKRRGAEEGEEKEKEKEKEDYDGRTGCISTSNRNPNHSLPGSVRLVSEPWWSFPGSERSPDPQDSGKSNH